MIQQSVPQELEKQKANLAVEQQKLEKHSSKVKSPVKRKLKVTNYSSTENDKRRRKSMQDNLEEDKTKNKKKKKQKKKKKIENKRKKETRDILDDNQVEQLRKYEKRYRK